MPYVLAFNRAGDRGEDRAARRLSAALPPSFDGVPARGPRAAQRSSTCRTRWPDFKVDGAKRDLIGDMAIVDPTAGGNPVKLTKEAALQLFQKALSGEV